MSGLKDILLNVGAVAGFAAILGLAVLAMLYFSQARDVRRLREWAGREPERAAEVELRAQQIASQAIAQAYESMALRQSEAQAAAGIAQEAGVEVPAPLAAESEPPPEGVEAPVADAGQETQAHDVVAEEFGGEVGEGELPAEDAADHLEHEVAEHDEEGAPVEASANGAGGETEVHPEPAEAGAAAAGAEGQSLLQPSTPAAARAAAPLPPLPPLDTAEFRPARPPSPTIPDYYLSTEGTGSGHFEAIEPPPGRSRVPFAVAGVLVAVFAVILIATQLLGGDDNNATPKRTPSTQSATHNTSENRNEKVNRAAVTVSVLNGTGTAGLAKNVSIGLGQAGFSDTTTGNLNDGKPHPTTTIYYAPGSKLEASEVAKELKVKDIQPATDEILAKGGSVPVIVVLGADFDQ